MEQEVIKTWIDMNERLILADSFSVMYYNTLNLTYLKTSHILITSSTRISSRQFFFSSSTKIIFRAYLVRVKFALFFPPLIWTPKPGKTNRQRGKLSPSVIVKQTFIHLYIYTYALYTSVLNTLYACFSIKAHSVCPPI